MTIPEYLYRVLDALANNWPTWRPSKETLRLYAMALSDLPEEVLYKAATHAIRRGKFAPSVAELRDYARPYLDLDEPPPAEEAWLEVLRAHRGMPAWSPGQPVTDELRAGPQWSHECVAQAAKVLHTFGGGWPTLKNEAADRAQFMSAYQRIAASYEAKQERAAVEAFSGRFAAIAAKQNGGAIE